MSPDDLVRLRHMAEAADAALRFSKGRTRADLDADDMLRFALTRAIEIIGEAAGRVSAETRSQTPGIAWTVIVGMRNRLVHAYFDVDSDILWNTVAQSLPSLAGELKRIVDKAG